MPFTGCLLPFLFGSLPNPPIKYPYRPVDTVPGSTSKTGMSTFCCGLESCSVSKFKTMTGLAASYASSCDYLDLMLIFVQF
jgi:hypothetical protein